MPLLAAVLCLGDHVVLATGNFPQSPDSIYFVHHGSTLVLSRIADRGGLILLFPSAGETDVEVVETRDPSAVLVERVVLIVRSCD